MMVLAAPLAPGWFGASAFAPRSRPCRARSGTALTENARAEGFLATGFRAPALEAVFLDFFGFAIGRLLAMSLGCNPVRTNTQAGTQGLKVSPCRPPVWHAFWIELTAPGCCNAKRQGRSRDRRRGCHRRGHCPPLRARGLHGLRDAT